MECCEFSGFWFVCIFGTMITGFTSRNWAYGSTRLLPWLIFFLLLSLSAFGQSKKQLEARKKQLDKEIAASQKLLKNTQSDRKASLRDLRLLQSQINSRAESVSNITQQLALLEEDMRLTDNQIDSLAALTDTLKQAYARLIRKEYVTQSTFDKLVFLFSAEDFNDAYQRYKYTRYIGEHRKAQLNRLKDVVASLEQKREKLSNDRVEQQALLGEEQAQKHALEKAKGDKDYLVSRLRKKEKELTAKISKKRKDKNALDAQIRSIIKKATAKATTAPSGKKIPLSPEMVKLSNKFADNKGKLPWPVGSGVITSRFGTNRHPVLKHISTTNNGLDIATKSGSTARAIFDGKVSNIINNPSFKTAVIVKHGNYFTVYANLSSVVVKQGDKIKVGQPLGMVYTDPDDKKTEVHLEVWQGGNKLNPERWIKRR